MSLLAPEWLTLTFVAGVVLLLVTIALSQSRRLRRWALPALLLTVSAVLGALALAVPATLGPTSGRPVAVVVDVSPSMGADDVAPSRLRAVQDALRGWLRTLPEGQLVSLTSFSGTVTQLAPTVTPAQAATAVDRLALGRSTAVGTGMAAAADTLRGEGTLVVISDGTTNVGKPGNQAARDLRPGGVLVHGIVVGTDKGVATVDDQAASVPVEAGEIKAAVAVSGGRYAEAKDAAAIRAALDALDLRVGFTRYSWLAWLASGLALLAGAVAALLRRD